MDRLFGGLGRFVVRFRWLVVVAWLVGTIAAVSGFPSLASEVNFNNSGFLPASAPSNVAADLAKPLTGTFNQSSVQIVAVDGRGTLGASDEAALASLVGDLHKVDKVTKVTFFGESPDRKAAQILVLANITEFNIAADTTLVGHLNTVLAAQHLPAGLSLSLAGPVVTNVDNQKNGAKQGNNIQTFSLLFILILLFFIFRSVLAPFITLLGPLFAVLLSGSLIGELGAHGLQISFFTQILLIVLLLGAGTDYGLFLVFRVREELLSGREPKDAIVVAMTRVGESISASAGTVIIALLTLTLASFGLYHDLGIPLAIGVAVMLLAGLTLIPALLAIFGRKAFWPTKTAPREHGDGVWGRVAGRLVRRPALTLMIGVLAFGVVSLGALGYKSGGFGGKTTAPTGTEAARGNAEIAAHFATNAANPTDVVMTFTKSVWTNPGPLQIAQRGLEESSTLTHITGPLNPTGVPVSPADLALAHDVLHESPEALAASGRTALPAHLPIPPALFEEYLATSHFISATGTVVTWQVDLSAGSAASSTGQQSIPKVRTQVTAAGEFAGAAKAGVAGEAPALYDVANISGNDLRHIIPIAILAIGLLLLLVIRSLIAPIYLIVSVVLSYLASLGLAVLLFVDIEHTSGIVFLLPFLMFIFLLALGEDYNILVMTRIREEAHKLPLRKAVVRAIGTTGPTVTSAGLVLAGSFTVLAVVGGAGPTGEGVREIGFALAFGILLDTFVVRTVLVPATVSLLGRWNWWPSKLADLTIHDSSTDPDDDGPGGGGRGPGGGNPGDGDTPDGTLGVRRDELTTVGEAAR